MNIRCLGLAVFVLVAAHVLCAAGATVDENALTNGLELYLSFDRVRDDSMPDDSSHGRDGKVVGATPEEQGLFGGAASFDGTNAYLDTGSWNVSGDQITISAWIYPRTGYQQVIIAKSFAATHEAPFYRWLLFKGYHNCLHFRIGDATLDSREGQIVDGEWQHVAAVYDGSQMRLYHDGQQVSVAPQNARLEAGGQHVRIGGRDTPASGLAEFFDGLIDDVAVWSRALSSDEIAALYERGARGFGAISMQEASVPAAEPGQVLAPAIRLLGTNAVPTVAVLPVATDDVTRAAADLLQLKLVGDGMVKVVERAELEKVLKEQTLDAAFGSGAVSERVKLGGLLRADMLVFVERRMADDGEHELMEVSAAETRMGLRVARETTPWNQDARDAEIQRLAIEVEKAVNRLRRGFSMIIAVPAFECRDISVDYLYLRKPYARLVERALLSRPGVLVVDIEDADALAREYFVSSSPAQIERPLPYYLKGSYRNEGLGSDRSISVELTLEQGRSPVGTERMDGLTEPALAEALDAALSKLVGKLAPSPARTRLAGQQEARLLTEQGKAISDIGSARDAIPFFETASLLDPQFVEPRLRLFIAYSELHLMTYRGNATPAEEVDMTEKAFDYLESALPNWQGELGFEVVVHYRRQRVYPVFLRSSYGQIADPELQDRYRTMVRRMAALGAEILESPAALIGREYANLETTLDRVCKRLSEFDTAGGLAARERVCRAYARRPQAFSFDYHLIRGWLDEDGGGAFRARLEKIDDASTRLALRVYDLTKTVQDLEQLNQVWPDVVLAAGENGDLKNALGLLRWREIEPSVQKESEPATLYVDPTLPPVVLVPLAFGPVGRIHDWICTGRHGEYIATEQGVFRLTPGGLARKVADGDTGRLVWDGLHVWAVREGVVSVLDAGGTGILNIQSEDLNYSIHSGELKLVPLEPGWMCLIGNAEQDHTLRRWVTTVDIRDKAAGKPLVDTFFQMSANRKDFMQNDWALKWKGGPPYVVLTRGAQINVSERTVSDYRHELDGICPFRTQYYVPHETALAWGEAFLMPVANGRNFNYKPSSQVDSAILELPALDQQPRVWLMHPQGINLGSGGAAHRAVFIADGWMHFILPPGIRPAWYATDLQTKETRVVSYDLPKEIDSTRTGFNVYTSAAFGIVMTIEGEPYKVKLPPSKQWAFFGSPKEYQDQMAVDPAVEAAKSAREGNETKE